MRDRTLWTKFGPWGVVKVVEVGASHPYFLIQISRPMVVDSQDKAIASARKVVDQLDQAFTDRGTALTMPFIPGNRQDEQG